MLVTVTTVGTVRPTKPLTPLELAKAVQPYLNKTFQVTVEPTHTVQQLADAVDQLMGVNPAETFEEVLIEDGAVLDKSKTLAAAGISNGDKVSYRFVIRV
jgi:hypothetical protein